MHFYTLSLKTCNMRQTLSLKTCFSGINIQIVFVVLFLQMNLSLSAQGIYHFRHISAKEGLSNNEVKSLFFDDKGNLWIDTQDGWNCWDRHQVTKANDDKERHPLASMQQSVLSWKYISTKNQLLCKQNGRQNVITIPSDGSSFNTVLDVKDDGNGNVWIATDHQGVYIYNKVEKKLYHENFSASTTSGIAENHVSCIAVGQNGEVALGHLKKGVSYYNPAYSRFTHFQSASWRNVSSLLQDHLGNIWVGTDGFGLINVSKRKSFNIPGNIVVTMMEDKQGRLWVGTYKQGLLCYEEGKLTKTYTTQNSHIADNSIYSLCQDRKGNLWIGTLWGNLQCLNLTTGAFSDFKTKDKDESVAMDMWYDGKNQLYVGTLSGLAVVDVQTCKRNQVFGNVHDKPFLRKDIQSVLRDKRGLLWIAHSKGVTVWNMHNDSIFYLDKGSGLCDDVIRSICEDSQGRIWIGTSNGCSVLTFPKAKRDFVPSDIRVDNLSTADGLLDDNMSRHSIICLRDGNLMMGSYEGYSFVNLMGNSHELENVKAYELGEEYSVWTSWKAIVCYLLLLFVGVCVYLWMRHTKKKVMAEAIKKAEEILAQRSANMSSEEKAKQVSRYIEVKPSEIEISSLDEQLIMKATQYVEKNMSNEFTVEDLSATLGLTRGHLYKKLTALTGKSPVEFIRILRMKRACQLLESSGMQVAEVAYAVGYSSPKIFSRNFKAEMGMSPSEYKNKETQAK